MDYEKVYKDALERAKEELKTCGSMDYAAARQVFKLFPELAESDDDRIINGLLDIFSKSQFGHWGGMEIKDIVAWLERQKEQNPGDKDRYMEGYINGMNDALKELKEQKPAEWNEEDEKHRESILKRLDGMCKHGATFTQTRFAVSEDMDWLKSLRPSWKPSEEQMKVMKEVVFYFGDSWVSHKQEVLESLYNDLKSL